MTDDNYDLDEIVAEITKALKRLNVSTRAKPIPPGTQHVVIHIHNVEQLVLSGSSSMANYENKGQVGAMGDSARSDNNTFIQSAPKDIDLPKLAKELARVRAEMKRSGKDDPDADAEIGAVAQAEKAAKEGDPSKAMQFLKSAGKWTLDVAKTVAANLVKDVIEGKFGD